MIKIATEKTATSRAIVPATRTRDIRYALRDIQTAFETFRDRKDGAQKVVIEFPAYRP